MAVDFYLKLGDIDGESKDAGLEKWIQVESWSLGASNGASASHGGGLAAGKVSLQDLHFTMKMSSASSKIFLAVASGKHYDTAELRCRKNTGGETPEDFVKIKMSDVMVSSWQTGGSAHGDELPTEQISLAFTKYQMEYFEQDGKGKLQGKGQLGWDLKLNKKA